MIKHSKMNEPVFLYKKPKMVSPWLKSTVISQITSFLVLISLEIWHKLSKKKHILTRK